MRLLLAVLLVLALAGSISGAGAKMPPVTGFVETMAQIVPLPCGELIMLAGYNTRGNEEADNYAAIAVYDTEVDYEARRAIVVILIPSEMGDDFDVLTMYIDRDKDGVADSVQDIPSESTLNDLAEVLCAKSI